ncbi:alkaline phosphatase-like [Macrobrachium rosenbergii]|uniref:alkaline phosphatase-like n=1 Tax=Macrobrachium rosenbergii TaxID=79674 RepID=UPI0034D53618
MARLGTVFSVASLILGILLGSTAQIFPVPRTEDTQFWHAHAAEEIQNAMAAATSYNWGIAKNVVLFVGDGMGITPSVAGRIFKGQQRYGHSGEEGYLSWEKFPHMSLVKVYNADRQVPDSAATATAFLCGAKGNYYTVGLDSSVSMNQCLKSLNPKAWQQSVLSWAQDDGKDTGFVTTTTVTHATPAALYAHSPNREWECDSSLGPEGHGCRDIARQLVEDLPGKNIKVIMGGGRLPMGAVSGIQEPHTCTRTDTRNLAKEWISSKIVHGRKVSYVQNKQELLSVDTTKTDYLLGLFANGHMSYETDRKRGLQGEPSLANMTSTAIKILSKNKHRGFFLMVEGGRIDHALHNTQPAKALQDILAFDDAITTALSIVDLKETLFIVTSDHSHVMTINGYPTRGNNILGVADISAVDHLPYTTLMFTNGPSYDHYWNGTHVTRPDVSSVNISHKEYTPIVAVPNVLESHGGDDVATYAQGPMAHLFHTLHEQTYIAHVMGFAACIGPYKINCTRPQVHLSRILRR